MESVGDLARSLVLRTNQVRLREEMDTLAVEVATGFVKDTAKHLRGDLSGLMAIDRSLERLEAFRLNNAEASLVSGTMQVTLGEIQDRTQSLSQTLIAAELTPSDALLTSMADSARDALSQVVGGLNRSVAGRFLFSGTATDGPALPDVDAIVSSLSAAAAGQTTAAGVQAVVDAFFDVGGDFETTQYQGSNTGLAPLRISENETISLDIRATDDVFREVLKPLAMAVLTADASLALDLNVRVEMMRTAGEDLLGSQKPLVEMRGSLGALEARIEDSTATIETERTATQLARLELVGADQYETASRYESIRGQLESLYAITARSQRLSLAEFL